MNSVSKLKSRLFLGLFSVKGYSALRSIGVLTLGLCVLINLLFVPLVGRAESTTITTVYNAGYTYPSFYLVFVRDCNLLFEDDLGSLYPVFGRAVFGSIFFDGSSWAGSRESNLTLYTDDDIIASLPPSLGVPRGAELLSVGVGSYSIYTVSTLDHLFSDDNLQAGLEANEFSLVPLTDFPISLSNGFKVGYIYNMSMEDYSITATASLVLRALQPQVVFGEFIAESDDYSIVENGLIVPSAPPLPSDGYINIDAIRHCASAFSVFPSSVLVALMSTVSLSLGLSLFLILKHS